MIFFKFNSVCERDLGLKKSRFKIACKIKGKLVGLFMYGYFHKFVPLKVLPVVLCSSQLPWAKILFMSRLQKNKIYYLLSCNNQLQYLFFTSVISFARCRQKISTFNETFWVSLKASAVLEEVVLLTWGNVPGYKAAEERRENRAACNSWSTLLILHWRKFSLFGWSFF